MKTKLAMLAFALTMQPSFAQEVSPLVLEGREIMPDMGVCSEALAKGQLLKTDATGAYHIAIVDLYLIISVDETQMTCRMFMHVYRS